MRMTIDIDDELFTKASKLAGTVDHCAVVSEGLKALIQRESAQRLARLGSTEPTLTLSPRQRSETKP